MKTKPIFTKCPYCGEAVEYDLYSMLEHGNFEKEKFPCPKK